MSAENQGYEKPIIVKESKLFHYFGLFRRDNGIVVCRQCSSCHSCR